MAEIKQSIMMNYILHLLAWMYRQGVYDAYYTNDAGKCYEFIDKLRNTACDYGFLDSYVITDINEFRLRLSMRMRSARLFRHLQSLDVCVKDYGSSFYSCFYPIAKDFYLDGATDYIENPDAGDIMQYKSKNSLSISQWTERGIRSVPRNEFIERVQLKTFEMSRRYEEWATNPSLHKRNRNVLPSRYWEGFRMALAILTYPMCKTYV